MAEIYWRQLIAVQLDLILATMQLGNIDSGATGSGINGNITLIAGGPNAGTILISNIITVGGTSGGGNVIITTAQPMISGNGTMTIDGSGNITSGNTIVGSITWSQCICKLGQHWNKL